MNNKTIVLAIAILMGAGIDAAVGPRATRRAAPPVDNRPTQEEIKQWVENLKLDDIAHNMRQLSKKTSMLGVTAETNEKAIWQEITDLLEELDGPLTALENRLGTLPAATRSATSTKIPRKLGDAIKSLKKEKKQCDDGYFKVKPKSRFVKQTEPKPEKKDSSKTDE